MGRVGLLIWDVGFGPVGNLPFFIFNLLFGPSSQVVCRSKSFSIYLIMVFFPFLFFDFALGQENLRTKLLGSL